MEKVIATRKMWTIIGIEVDGRPCLYIQRKGKEIGSVECMADGNEFTCEVDNKHFPNGLPATTIEWIDRNVQKWYDIFEGKEAASVTPVAPKAGKKAPKVPKKPVSRKKAQSALSVGDRVSVIDAGGDRVEGILESILDTQYYVALGTERGGYARGIFSFKSNNEVKKID